MQGLIVELEGKERLSLYSNALMYLIFQASSLCKEVLIILKDILTCHPSHSNIGNWSNFPPSSWPKAELVDYIHV